MAQFGDYVTYDGLIYRIVAISEDAEPTYTIEPVRRSEESITKTVTSSQKQIFLVPGGGDNITGVALESLTPVGSRTATANALADGKVRIKFDSDGGTAVASQIIDEGDLVTKPDDPTKEHYTFDAWYNDVALTDATDFAADTFDDDSTIYAKWIIDTFTVTYDSNEGLAVASETVDYGKPFTEPDDPTLEGSVFAGWYTDDETFENLYVFTTLATEDIALYAKWTLAG